MSKAGRPKIDNPSKYIVACKLTKDEYLKLLKYCKSCNVSKSYVIKRGIKSIIEENL